MEDEFDGAVLVLLHEIPFSFVVNRQILARRRQLAIDVFQQHNNWLRSYGYLYKSTADDELSINDVSAAIQRMQAFASLPETGEVDADTLEVMKMPRCGLPDFQQDEDGQIKRYTTRPGWTKTTLTYKFESYTNDISQSDVRSTLAAAFKLWSDVSPIEFSLVTGSADIVIKFQGGNHGDGIENAFDGRGRVLAHAFYPQPHHFGGDIHYDDDEPFRKHSTNSNDIDLLWVSVHEIGHSLGIDHSGFSDAIMTPSYKRVSNVRLHHDDLGAILKVYCQFYTR